MSTNRETELWVLTSNLVADQKKRAEESKRRFERKKRSLEKRRTADSNVVDALELLAADQRIRDGVMAEGPRKMKRPADQDLE